MKSDNYLDNLPASINPSKGKGIELVYALVSDVSGQ